VTDGRLHYSALRAFAKSPAHYLALLERPRTDSAPMRLGRLVHALVLGGAYVIFDGTRRGKTWDEFQAQHDGEDIFTVSEHEDAQRIASAVIAHDEAMSLLAGEHELSLQWTLDGRECAGRIDALTPECVTDLKTTADAHPERFTRQAIRMGYHAQLAWYADAVASTGRPRPTRHCLVAVETEHPHVITTLELTPAAVEAGRALYRSWLAQLADCERTGRWPGYAEGTIPLDVYRATEEEDAMEGLVIGNGNGNGHGDITAEIAALRQRQAELFGQAEAERRDLLTRLGALCGLLGPIRRADIPRGVLIRRERKTAPVPSPAHVKRARKPKPEPTEATA